MSFLDNIVTSAEPILRTAAKGVHTGLMGADPQYAKAMDRQQGMQERGQRMRLNEILTKIKMAGGLETEAGRRIAAMELAKTPEIRELFGKTDPEAGIFGGLDPYSDLTEDERKQAKRYKAGVAGRPPARGTLSQKAEEYKSDMRFLEGAGGEPGKAADEADQPLYDKIEEAYKDVMRQRILKLEKAEKKGISTTRTAPSKGFQFGDLGAGFGLPSMSGGRPTMGAKGGMPTTGGAFGGLGAGFGLPQMGAKGGMPQAGGAFGGLGAERGVPEEYRKLGVTEYRPPTAPPIEPTPVQTKRPGFLGRKESEFPAGFRTPPLKDETRTPRTIEEFDSLFMTPKTNYERPSYLKLRSIWLDLPEEIQDKVTAALRRVGYKAVIGAEDLKPYLE